MGLRTISAAILALWPAATAAVECHSLRFDDLPFTTCTVDPAKDSLQLFLHDDSGAVLGGFPALDARLAQTGHRLGFAMNAGMYHADRAPVGLYIEDGKQIAPLVTSAGPGNFGLLPNGVFCVGAGWARVMETRAFGAAPPACRHATQSGPMLVIDGALHPRFLPDSSSQYIRNGVGVRDDGTVVFAISDAPVRFHTFGRLFRDRLDTPHALYLDGKISRLHAPGLGRSDPGFLPMGPIVGVVADGG